MNRIIEDEPGPSPVIDALRAEIDRLTRELAGARAEAVRLRSYNEGLAKIAADLERERDEALAVLERVASHRPGTPGLHYDSAEQLLESACGIAQMYIDEQSTPK